MAYETELSWCLPGVRPSHHPFLHCPHSEDDFCLLQCLILTFWPKLWRFKVKSFKNGAKSAYFEADLGVGSHFGPLCRQKRSKSPPKKFPITLTLLAWWWAQKNLHFGHSSQSYKRLKFRPKAPLCRGFDFGLICACGSCSKRATIKAFWPISPHLFFKPLSFCLEWTFWTFSVLKMIVLSLAIWWAQKYFAFDLICPCGGCSNRVPIRADFAIFQGGVTFCSFTLACCQPNVVNKCTNTLWPLLFTLSLDTTPS